MATGLPEKIIQKSLKRPNQSSVKKPANKTKTESSRNNNSK